MFDFNRRNVVDLIVDEIGITAAHILGSSQALNKLDYPQALGKNSVLFSDLKEVETKVASVHRMKLLAEIQKNGIVIPRNVVPMPDGMGDHSITPEIVSAILTKNSSPSLSAHPNTSNSCQMFQALSEMEKSGQLNWGMKYLTILHELSHVGYGVLPRQILISWFLYAVDSINRGITPSDLKLYSMGYDQYITASTPEEIAAGIKHNRDVYESLMTEFKKDDSPDVFWEVFDPVFDALFDARTESSATETSMDELVDSTIKELGMVSSEEVITPVKSYSVKVPEAYPNEALLLSRLATMPTSKKASIIRYDDELNKYIHWKILSMLNGHKTIYQVANILGFSHEAVRLRISRNEELSSAYSSNKPALVGAQVMTAKSLKKVKIIDIPNGQKLTPKISTTVETKIISISKDKKTHDSAQDVIDKLLSPSVRPTPANHPQSAEHAQKSGGGVQFKDCIETLSSGIGMTEFFYSKIMHHRMTSPQGREAARRKLELVHRMRALMLELGSN